MRDPSQDLDSVLDDYRKVLFDWNDNINRLLALVQTYFGTGIRQHIEEVIFEEFTSIGRALDHGVRRVSASLGDVQTIPRVGHRLTDLSHRVYRLNVRMLKLFESGLLGDEAPESFEADLPWLAFGAQGPAVTELQQALLHAGYDVTPDGLFGPATHSAIRSL